MKKHELLKYAYDNYPKGTKFKTLSNIPQEVVSSGDLRFGKNPTDVFILDNNTDWVIYGKDAKWAEIVSDKKPLLVSEDGVDLFEGDLFWSVSNEKWDEDDYEDKGWQIKNVGERMHKISSCSAVVRTPYRNKAFFTKQAALDWIEKANKPKEIEVKLYFTDIKAVVSANSVKIRCIEDNFTNLTLKPSDIEDISHALKQLQ